jgi:hypothetical protein
LAVDPDAAADALAAAIGESAVEKLLGPRP